MARDLMSDEEWAFFERFILAVRARNGRKPVNHRLVLDGIFWIARTGASWRALPEAFGKWSSVYRQFRRWTLAGLWERIGEALEEDGAIPAVLAARRRASHQAGLTRQALRDRLSAVQAVAARPPSTCASSRRRPSVRTAGPEHAAAGAAGRVSR